MHQKLLFLLLPVLLLSCKGVNDITVTGAEGFSIRGMENNKVSFVADIGVLNPSSVGFKISEINLKTSVDGNFIGTLTSPDQVRIPAHSDSSYRMNFSLEIGNILTSASTLYTLSRKKQLNIDMQGYVKARSWLMTRTIEIHETQVIDVPENFR
jgi:LEA14-like dessication related protein